MRGLIQERPLAVPLIFHRIEEVFPQGQIISVRAKETVAVSYSQWADDVRRIASGLLALGLEPGDRVATLCANTLEHLSLYYAVPSTGFVLHTVNHRLSREHIEYIVNDGGARVLIVDGELLAALPPLDHLPQVRTIFVVGESASVDDPRVRSFDELLKCRPFDGDFVIDDEFQAASICYTSGTTGMPKGVVYSHRSVVLVALMALATDVMGLGVTDVVMPIVPMFHANAWGLPYSSAFAGADLVLPGHGRSGADLVDLLVEHQVTITAAVASVWRDMLPHTPGRDWSHLRRLLTGGGPLPVSLSRAWRESTGLTLTNSWGMTELGPIGTIARVRRHRLDETPEQQLEDLSLPGFPAPLVRLRVGGGRSTPGTVDELEVCGPTVAGAYLGGGGEDRFTPDGWLRTGDAAHLDPYGELRITDRLKDVIKSGGEWISSIDLENAIMDHPKVKEASVIGVAHDRWDERPIAFVVTIPGAQCTQEDLLEHLRQRVAKFWLPDRIVFREQLPRTSTGKISKSLLREQYAELQDH